MKEEQRNKAAECEIGKTEKLLVKWNNVDRDIGSL